MTNSIFIKKVKDLCLIRDYCTDNHPALDKSAMIVRASTKGPGKHARPKMIESPSFNDIRRFLRFQCKVNLFLNDEVDATECSRQIKILKGEIKETPPEYFRFTLRVRSAPHFYQIVSRLNMLTGRREGGDGWRSSDHWTTDGKVRSRLRRRTNDDPINVTFIIYNTSFPKEEASFLSLI